MGEELPVLVKDGDTPIHQHPDFEAVLKPVLNEFYMTPTEDRPYSWNKLAELMAEDWPHLFDDIKDPGDYIKKWCQRYLASSWQLTPEMVRKRVAEADQDIVSAIEYGEQARAILEDVKLSREREQEVLALIDQLQDADEDEAEALTKKLKSILSFTMGPSERAATAKKAADLMKMRDEELERWRIIPSKKKGTEGGINIMAENFNLGEHFEQSSGRRRARTIDVEGD